MNKRIVDLKIEAVVNKLLFEKKIINQTQYQEALKQIERLVFEERQRNDDNKL